MKEYHILNLGAGVQSTALYLLSARGEIPIKFDYAIFADTQEEPEDKGESVYEHLAWLEQQNGAPIIRATAGKLGDDLKLGRNSTGQRFASIPAFTKSPEGKIGKTRRQCTKEYKIEVVERAIRREILKLQPRQWIKGRAFIHQYIGISVDEASRMVKQQKRLAETPIKWAQFHWPLIETLQWNRHQCRAYLAKIVPHRVPRSACVFCPFHDNGEWQRIKLRNGRDWARVVEVDRGLRVPGAIVNRKMDGQLFLHPSCRPIDEIDFTDAKTPSDDMRQECLGMCGN